MVDFFSYLLKVSCCSAVFYTFYYLLLRKEKLFALNRFYLLLTIALSLVLPVVKTRYAVVIPPARIVATTITETSVATDVFIDGKPKTFVFGVVDLLKYLYLIGAGILVFVLLHKVAVLLRLLRLNSKTRIGRNVFVLTENLVSPFSFFHVIFIEKSGFLTHALPKLIVEHEKVHSKQLHSFDILVSELFIVFLWFNPFAWFYRKSIAENHEYLADAMVLNAGNNMVEYMKLLAYEVFRQNKVGISSPFNCLTKKRLLMMSKIKPVRYAWPKFLLILPLLIAVTIVVAKPFSVVSIAEQTELKIENTVPSIWPVKKEHCNSVSGYGLRKHPIYKINTLHVGQDFQANIGEPVMATAPGIVTTVETQKGEGKFIVISHDSVFQTKYTHLSAFSVKPGQKVLRGQVIGKVGNTGMSTGPHLHYEVIKNGKNVNPSMYLK